MKNIKIILLLLSCFLSSCGGGGGGGSDGDNAQGVSGSATLELRADESITDASGFAAFLVEIPSGATGVQLIAESPGANTLRLSSFTSASGADVITQSSEVGVLANREAVAPLVINFPYVGGGNPAGTYTVRFQAFGNRNALLAGQTVTLKAYIKRDADLSSGTIKVNLVYLGPVADAQEVRDAVVESISVMRQIYSRAGLTIDLSENDVAGPAQVESPINGNILYSEISSTLRPEAVNVVLATDVKRNSSRKSGNDYGEAGATPGPLTAGAHSAVAISILDITGSDGRFDFNGLGGTREHNDEKRLLGEEMARLTANYLGLANALEISGSRVTSADTLSESPSCISDRDCREDASARTNTMMPEPFEKRPQDRDLSRGSRGREYYPRDQWSNDQKAVLNASVFVN